MGKVHALPLKTFEVRLDRAVNNLICLKVPLIMAGGLG